MSGYYERLSVPRNSVNIFFKYLLFTCRKKGFQYIHIEMKNWTVMLLISEIVMYL